MRLRSLIKDADRVKNTNRWWVIDKIKVGSLRRHSLLPSPPTLPPCGPLVSEAKSGHNPTAFMGRTSQTWKRECFLSPIQSCPRKFLDVLAFLVHGWPRDRSFVSPAGFLNGIERLNMATRNAQRRSRIIISAAYKKIPKKKKENFPNYTNHITGNRVPKIISFFLF